MTPAELLADEESVYMSDWKSLLAAAKLGTSVFLLMQMRCRAADSPEEADKKFWDTLQRPCAACKNEVYEVIGIEEKKEEE